MQAIGIEKGKPFNPDAKTKALLAEAARIGGAIARANTYASPAPDVFYYPDRKWQGVPAGLTYTFTRDGVPQIDARNNVYYMAAGNYASDDGEEHRRGFAISLDLPGCGRQFPRRREELQASHPAQHPGQELLVGRRLRRAQPVGVAERAAVSLGQQLHQADRQCRRLHRHRLRSRRAEAEGQLDQDGSRQGLVPDLPLLWACRSHTSTRPGS